MAPLATLQLESLDALLANAAAWDDLWQRSAATLPSLRAKQLALWFEHFAEPEQFTAMVVRRDDRWLAALPLANTRIAHVISAASMPCNDWATCGDLLLDETIDPQATLAALIAALRKTSSPLLWLQEASLDAQRWQLLQQVCAVSRATLATHPCYQVGRVVIDHDWDAYRARWSRKHRQAMAHSLRTLSQRGDVRMMLQSQFAPGEVTAVLQECFELEDRGWKGQSGSSVLRQPGLLDFYKRQAELTAEHQELEVARLYCGEQLIAFSYGLSAKGVFHSTKIGYDPDFACEHPGQLLRHLMLERFFSEPARKALDFQGPTTEAHAAWLPERFSVGRFVLATDSLPAQLAVAAYRRVWPALRSIKHAAAGV